MEYTEIVCDIADQLKEFDSEGPVHKQFKPGIGPFGEPQLVKEISNRLNFMNGKYDTVTKRVPDLKLNEDWAIEFKIVRPYGDNGDVAENWSVNVLHPYEGNVSLIGDTLKLCTLEGYLNKGVILIGYEHDQARISLDPLIDSFELITTQVIGVRIGRRIEEKRSGLIHPEHQIVRCIGWEVYGRS